MGCGSSNAVTLTSSTGNECINEAATRSYSVPGVSGVYSITSASGAVTHTLVLLDDGRVIIDGYFAQSVVYRQGRKQFKFTIVSEQSDLISGEIQFYTESDSLNGVFRFSDSSSYVVHGVRDGADPEKNKITEDAKGKHSVVIDETTLEKYKKIERQLERYQKMELLVSITEMTERAQQLEISIKEQVEDIEKHRTKLEQEKEAVGVDSELYKSLEIELESKCLALAADQQQYDATLDYIRTRTGDLFDYNILSEQFDELLNAMFRGDGGSDIENQLEAMVEEAEEAKSKHEESFDKEEKIWEDAKGINLLMLQGLNTWSSLEQDGSTNSKREFLAKQTRSLLSQIIDQIVELEVTLKEYESYIPEDECRLKLIYFRDNIFTMFECSEGIAEGVDTFMYCTQCTRHIEQWVYDNLRIKDCQEKSESLKQVVLEAKLKLKQERRNLMEDWLMEHVGAFEKEETVVSSEPDNKPLDVTSPEPGIAVEEFNIEETYEQIVARFQSGEKRSDLDGIRAELDLQDKIRSRRKRQRHQRAQKLILAQSPPQITA